MSKTKQGAFPETYGHIEAPTIANEVLGREKHIRKLCVPQGITGDEDIYRSSLIYYLSRLRWQPRRKLDGENIRIKWDGEQALWNGKSNNFQCSAGFTDYMNSTFLEEIFEEKFGRDKTVILFGEHMGPKVQGNELGLEKDEVVLFDVQVNGTWLKEGDVYEVSRYFGIKHWSDYGFVDEIDLETLIQDVARGEFNDWEGVVAVPKVEIRAQNGQRVIVKVKRKDYYLEVEENEIKRKSS